MIFWLVASDGRVCAVTVEDLTHAWVAAAAAGRTWCYSADQAFALSRARRQQQQRP